MSLFFELLQLALGNRGQLSAPPTEAEWAAVWVEARRQAVMGVLLSGVERLPAEQRPPRALLLRWIGEVQMIEATGRLHRERAAALTRIFRDAGISSCVLKGVSVALLYPSPLRRQCGDIDLWVDGRREDVMAFLRSRYEVGEVRWHHADVKVFWDVQTEIHFHATWLFNPFRNARQQRWLGEYGLPCCVLDEQVGFCRPTAKFNAVYALVHAFHHLLESGIGFRHVVDYYYVCAALGSEGGRVEDPRSDDARGEAVRMVGQLGMRRFLAAMMYVLQEACGAPSEMLLCPPDEQEGRFLLSEMMAGGNFGQRRADGLVRNSLARWWLMVRHYPGEVLWMLPWKVWHWGWRAWAHLSQEA